MKRTLVSILAGLLVAAGLSCAGPESEAPAVDAAVERAKQAAQALGRDLMRRLVSEMESGGPVKAVRVCSEVAQDVAAAHSTEGLTVRRVSLKVRNPADAPDEYERAALVELERLHAEGKMPSTMTEVVETGEGRRLRFLRPIVIMPPCLACHGPEESIDPEVARIIAERYPADRATGYADGDLRGAISVTVALD